MLALQHWQARHHGPTRIPSPQHFRVLHVIKSGNFDPATTRYRTYNIMEALADRGVEVNYLDVDEAPHQLDFLASHDLIVLMRRAFCPEVDLVVQLARQLEIPVVFDCDDYLFDTEVIADLSSMTDFTPYMPLMIQLIDLYRRSLNPCEYYSGTNEILAGYVERYDKKAFIIRNGLNRAQLAIAANWVADRSNSPRGDKLRLGYFSGSPTHQDDFKLIADVLGSILREFPAVQLVVGGSLETNCYPGLNGLEDRIERVPFQDWRNLVHLIGSVDVNLIPLQRGRFWDAKSDLKYYEAGLLKVPSIATRNPVYEKAIQPGWNGFLAQSPEEWHQHLRQLIVDPDLRIAMGERAREHVLREYVPEVVGGEAHTAYTEILQTNLRRLGHTQAPFHMVILTSNLQRDLHMRESYLEIVREATKKGSQVTFQLTQSHGCSAAELSTELQKHLGGAPVRVQIGEEPPTSDHLLVVDNDSLLLAFAQRKRTRQLQVWKGASLNLDGVDRTESRSSPWPWVRRKSEQPIVAAAPKHLLWQIPFGIPAKSLDAIVQLLRNLSAPGLEIKILLAGNVGIFQGGPGFEYEIVPSGPNQWLNTLEQLHPVCLLSASARPPRLMWDCLALSCPVVLCVPEPNFPVHAVSEIAGCSIPRPDLLRREVKALFDNSVLYAQRVRKGWEAASRLPLLAALLDDRVVVCEPISKHDIVPATLKVA